MHNDSVIGSGDHVAEIRWTAHGVPHVRADDWGSLGFGQGYACAEHHLATIADQVCKVRSERSRYLGRGPDDIYLNSDIGYRVLGLHNRAAEMMESQPPHVTELVSGFAAGLNAWLDAGDRSRLPAWCADSAWIGRIDAVDIFAYALDLALAASGRNLIDYMARACPPGPDGPAPTPPLGMLGAGLASNGWAVGRSVSSSGHGIIVANPHFPWYGEARFWECHLTIPGTLDVYGAALVGTPAVQIGFNRHVAWTHTFSIGKRFTIYKLTLEKGCSTRYLVDGRPRDMTEETVTVEVGDPDGGCETVSRTVWRSEMGPMLNLPLFGWTEEFGFTFRDANADGDHFVSQWLGMVRATDLDEFREVFRTENGIPWATTVVTDSHGKVWFIDASHTPNLSEPALAAYSQQLRSDPLTQLLDHNRVALLDGSDSQFIWQDESTSPAPGLLPFERLPQLERDDWIANCNESHWLANPSEPLVGYSPLLGPEGAAPSPRTRANLTALGTPGNGQGGTLDADELAVRLLSNRSVLADTLCDDVVKRLVEVGSACVGDRTVDLANAAAVLDEWDHTFDIEARGAVLWRETMAGFSDEALKDPGVLFVEPFTVAEPLTTPRSLAPAPESGPDPVADAVARAVLALESAGIDIDAPLGSVQWAARGSVRVPVHGGQETDGVTNILAPNGLLPTTSLEPVTEKASPIPGRTERTGLRVGGYEVTYGTSFLMVVEMLPDGPKARGLLSYGQSEDPASSHYSDQVGAYAAKELRPLLFANSDIESDPELRTEVVRG